MKPLATSLALNRSVRPSASYLTANTHWFDATGIPGTRSTTFQVSKLAMPGVPYQQLPLARHRPHDWPHSAILLQGQCSCSLARLVGQIRCFLLNFLLHLTNGLISSSLHLPISPWTTAWSNSSSTVIFFGFLGFFAFGSRLPGSFSLHDFNRMITNSTHSSYSG